MNETWTLVFAALVPFLCLGLLLWLARLEETLTDGIEGPATAGEPAPGAPAPAERARAAVTTNPIVFTIR